MAGAPGHRDAVITSREKFSDDEDPDWTHEVQAVDKGNGTVRITLPKRARVKLGIEPGDTVLVDEFDDRARVHRAPEDQQDE